MKKVFVFLLIAALTVGTLAGCNSDKSSDQTGSSSTGKGSGNNSGGSTDESGGSSVNPAGVLPIVDEMVTLKVLNRTRAGDVEDFEKLLGDVSRNDRDNIMTQTYRTSDTRKVYTMLAHASGRLGNG